jgi:hypothetical protein
MLHDNNRENNDAHTVESFLQLNFQFMNYPVYSSDMATSVTCFTHSEMLWDVAISPLTKKRKQWCMRGFYNENFFEGLQKLVVRWTKCFGEEGTIDSNSYSLR